MTNDQRLRAAQPEDLGRLVFERLDSGDVEGLAELYEPTAVLALPDGDTAVGREAIREAYAQLLAEGVTFTPGRSRPVLRSHDLALTSTLLQDGSVTAEIARRQPDGTWLWAVDQPQLAVLDPAEVARAS